jgi:hypothetical protein
MNWQRRLKRINKKLKAALEARRPRPRKRRKARRRVVPVGQRFSRPFPFQFSDDYDDAPTDAEWEAIMDWCGEQVRAGALTPQQHKIIVVLWLDILDYQDAEQAEQQ